MNIKRYRLSCVVRYQPAADPIDAQWIKNGTGHTFAEKPRAIEKARDEWGLK